MRSTGARTKLVLAPFAVIDRWIATGEVLEVGGQIRHGKQIFDMANRSVELEGYIRHREISFNAGYRTTTTFDRIAPLVHLPSISEHSLNFGLIGPWYLYFAGDCRAQHRFGPNGIRMSILICLHDPGGHRQELEHVPYGRRNCVGVEAAAVHEKH